MDCGVGEGAWRGINTGSIGGTDIAVPRGTRTIRNNSIVGQQSIWCNILPSIRYSIVSDCRRMRHGPNEASCWSKIDLDTFKQIRRRSDRRFYSF